MRRAKSSRVCSISIRSREDMHTHLKTVTTPLNRLGEEDLCPGSAALAEVNAGYR